VDSERLRDAYANAWRARGSGDDDEIQIEELDALADDVFGGPGPGRDLILALWERGVPPEALGRELVRSVPGLAWSWFASSARAVVEVARQLRPQGDLGEAKDLPGKGPAAWTGHPAIGM
jgi:hypothetical protein